MAVVASRSTDVLEILRFAVRAGVDHIDTAQFYGPDGSGRSG
jgi:aryl-alcohol dehydrogenase-like predicted oxidoreductase